MIQPERAFNIADARIRTVDVRNLRYVDWFLVAVVLALAIVGFLCLYSASRSTPTNYWQKQMLFFLLGAAAAAVVVCIDHRFLVWLAPALYAAALAALAAVLVSGMVVKGGQRWFALGPLQLQPSEFTKIAVVYMLTWYLARVQDRIRSLPVFLFAFAIAAVPALLIFKQPNLGTAVSLGPLVLAMLYAAGCKRWHLIAVVAAGLLAVPVAWTQLKDYHKARVNAYLQSLFGAEADISGDLWQTEQSKITIGSGGLAGKGYLQGTQTYLRYLPEHHTDFIFSLVGEEKGFVGAICVIGLYAILLLRGLAYARDCPELSGALLAVGVVTILAFHIFVNIAITVGLLPVTGLPLPFLSYGGSFYLTTMICIGILLNVPMRTKNLFG